MAGLKMGQGMAKDIHENITEGERTEPVDTMSQEMKESNPAFLRYLQFKVDNNNFSVNVRRFIL